MGGGYVKNDFPQETIYMGKFREVVLEWFHRHMEFVDLSYLFKTLQWCFKWLCLRIVSWVIGFMSLSLAAYHT